MGSKATQYELRESGQWTRGMVEADRFIYWFAGGIISLALLWLAFAYLVVPPVIESAYRGESLPFFNQIISGQTIHRVDHYLTAWQKISWRILGMLFVLGLIPLPLVVTRPQMQNYLEARFGRTLVLNPLVTNTILAFFGLASVFYLYYLHPVGYIYFTAEDYWAEYGSFVSWAMASCFFTWMLFKDRRLCTPGLVVLAFGTFFVAMEEISWGQRILDLRSPTLFALYNIQGETNLHNLNYVRFPKHWTGVAILLWSMVIPLMARNWGRFREWCYKLGIPIVPMHLVPFFLLAAFGLFSVRVFHIGEVGELFLAIAIALLSLDLVVMRTQGTRVSGIPAMVATAAVVITVSIITAFLVQFYSQPGSLKHLLNRFAMTSYPSAGMYRQAEVLFDYMSHHPQLSGGETHFRYGVLLMQMEQHTKAKEVLELALAEQKRFQQERPEDPGPYRTAGKVLTVLGRQEEAEVAFLEAIEKDQARLIRANDASDEASIRWSLAKSLLAMGDSKAASEQLSMARALAPDRITQIRMDNLLRENVK